MFNILKKIIQYPRLTQEYPKVPFDPRFITGSPVIDSSKCTFCGGCTKRCPSKAIHMEESSKTIGINLDECIFCSLCEDICPTGAAKMSKEFESAKCSREDLRSTAIIIEDRNIPDESYEAIGKKVEERIRKTFGRSLQIREVDAGSCNACDYEINALCNPMNDLERFGIHFVASPRHADMLLVTGTASRNMELALVKTYTAAPDPKLVVAVGACACSGGIFKDSYATRNGIDCIVPVDVYIPGCPPRPHALIYGILKALDRVK